MSDDLNRLDSYQFELPQELIAERPRARRSQSRLMELCPDGIHHHPHFGALSGRLESGDLIVVNDVRVAPSRLFAERGTGGRVELFVLNHPPRISSDGVRVDAMIRARRRLPDGEILRLRVDDLVHEIELERRSDGGTVQLLFRGLEDLDGLLARAGEMPLPPYIVKRRKMLGLDPHTESDRERYQTVYAREGRAVAAPTAGLHFDDALIQTLEAKGVAIAKLRLDVGAGTFRPVRTPDLDAHEMHSESYRVDRDLVVAWNEARASGSRIVAIGTTVVRALEDQFLRHGEIRPGEWSTNIFIRPGHRFRAIDGLVTNFHLPGSTLLVLVSAFAGRERVLAAYREAVSEGYRFFSYGDSSLLWPETHAEPHL